MHRVAGAIILIGVAALASGCSSGNGTTLPAAGNAAGASNYLRPQPAKGVTIQLFRDLPRYASYYGPSAIAVGSDGNLWVTDVIDQDFGENVVVRVAPSG